MKRVVVFAPHKTASTLFRTLMADLSRRSGVPFHCQDLGNFPTHWLLETDPSPFATAEGMIGPVRTFSPITDLPDTSIVLNLRDPRDVMVSLYYSFGFLHAFPKDYDATEDRKRWQEMGIDRFVTSDPVIWGPQAFRRSFGWQAVRDRYLTLLDNLAGRPNVTRLSYEQMFSQPDAWWHGFAAAFSGIVAPEHLSATRRLFIDEVTPPSEENITRHKRQMLPGDYARKLEPRTIAFLNEAFEPILRTTQPEA